MGRADHYRKGDYNVIDDVTGFKEKASQCRMQWDGKFTHRRNWSPRHPQDFVRSKTDRQTVPVARPDGDEQFIADLYPNGVTADDL